MWEGAEVGDQLALPLPCASRAECSPRGDLLLSWGSGKRGPGPPGIQPRLPPALPPGAWLYSRRFLVKSCFW